MATIQVILLNGTTADANEVMSNTNEIYTNINNSNVAAGAAIVFSKLENLTSSQIIVGNASNVPAAVAMSGAATIDNAGVVTLASGGVGGSLPIGSIIPFYDFNALVTFDTNYYRYCDGSVLTYAASPLDGETLPDLSGRYIVEFGS